MPVHERIKNKILKIIIFCKVFEKIIFNKMYHFLERKVKKLKFSYMETLDAMMIKIILYYQLL